MTTEAGGGDHVRSAVGHLQHAAAEMIAAAHAALDAVDEAVREPLDLGVLVGQAARLAQLFAERAWGSAPPPPPASDSDRDGPPPGRGAHPVEHIPVS